MHAILQRGLGATFATLSALEAHELAWCYVIVELPHHKGGLGITPLSASDTAAFYSATAHLVSWLGSLPDASEWVAGQNLADPNTWNISALQTLKQLHDNLLTHYKLGPSFFISLVLGPLNSLVWWEVPLGYIAFS